MTILTWPAMMLASLAYPALATLAVLVVFILLHRPITPTTFILSAMLAGVVVLAATAALGLLIPRQIPARAPQTTFRLAHLNALFYNAEVEEKRTFLQTANADVISLVEVNAGLAQTATRLKDLYPYQLSGGTDNAPGGHLPTLILSRYPVERVTALSSRLNLYKVQTPRGPLHILQTHPQSPYLPSMHQYRNSELQALATLNLPSPLIMVGDINTTPWDPALKPLRQKLTLRGSWLPTFPASLPMTPIDLLLTCGLPAPTLTLIRVKNTDHLGLIADFTL